MLSESQSQLRPVLGRRLANLGAETHESQVEKHRVIQERGRRGHAKSDPRQENISLQYCSRLVKSQCPELQRWKCEGNMRDD